MGVLNPSVDVYIRAPLSCKTQISLPQDQYFNLLARRFVSLVMLWHCFGSCRDSLEEDWHCLITWPVHACIAYMIEFELGDCWLPSDCMLRSRFAAVCLNRKPKKVKAKSTAIKSHSCSHSHLEQPNLANNFVQHRLGLALICFLPAITKTSFDHTRNWFFGRYTDCVFLRHCSSDRVSCNWLSMVPESVGRHINVRVVGRLVWLSLARIVTGTLKCMCESCLIPLE